MMRITMAAQKNAWATCIFGCVLSACGGAAGSGTPPANTPNPPPARVPMSLSPNALTFTAASQSAEVSVSEAGYAGAFSVTNANPAVAQVSSTSSGQFVVLALSAGTTTIQIFDQNGQAATLAVGVTTSSVGLDAMGKHK